MICWPYPESGVNGGRSRPTYTIRSRAFSLLVYTEQPLPTWLFLKKSRNSRRLPVQSRSENALVVIFQAQMGNQGFTLDMAQRVLQLHQLNEEIVLRIKP